jgi:hypothetical protein
VTVFKNGARDERIGEKKEISITNAPDTAYEFHKRHKSGGLEWVFVDEESKDKLVLQHLLVIDDSTIIKHWRQDWIYQNTDIYKYIKDLNWKFVKVPKEQVKGQWTQKVFQVDDSPRYQGAATWIHVDGKHYWESQADAPCQEENSLQETTIMF